MAKMVLPRVQAMVLCDDIEQVESSGESIDLLGVRAEIHSSSFPFVRTQLCVFVHMSGHSGEAQCHIEIESVATDEIVHEASPLTLTFDDPAEVVSAYFRLSNCVSAGVYYVQL